MAGLLRGHGRQAPVRSALQESAERRNPAPTRSPMSKRTSRGPTTMRPCSTSKRTRKPCSGFTSRSTGCGRIPKLDALVLSKRTRASTPGLPNPSRSASSSSTWRAPCRRSGGMRRPMTVAVVQRRFCRTSAIMNIRSSTWSDRFIIRTNWRATQFSPDAGARSATPGTGPTGRTWFRIGTIRSFKTSKCSSASSR